MFRIKKERGKIVALFAAAVFVLSTFIATATPFLAQAAPVTYGNLTQDEKLKVFAYARVIALSCFGGYSDIIETDPTKVNAGQLFYNSGNYKSIAYSNITAITSENSDFGDDFKAGCGDSDGALSKNALKAFGMKGLELVCAMGYKREDNQSCNGGDKRLIVVDNPQARFKAVIKDKLGLDIDNPGNDVQYLRWRETLLNGCTTGVKISKSDYDATGSNIRYAVDEVIDGKKSTAYYSGGQKTTDYAKGFDSLGEDYRCSNLLAKANSYFDAYYTANLEQGARKMCEQQGYKDIPGGSFPSTVDLTACIQGALHKNDGTFCNTGYPDITYQGTKVSRESARLACQFGRTSTVPPTDTSTGDEEEETTSDCVVEGVGWIVCPVVNFMAGVADATYSAIEGFLQFDSNYINSEQGTIVAWRAMQSIANVLLVIGFLVIIFSQLTGLGVSNYGIKKTLPRIIIVAIGINLSFILCQIAVDISNILGASLKDFLSNLPVFAGGDGSFASKITSESNFFSDIAVNILAGGAALTAGVAAGAAIYFFGLGFLIPILVAAIVAVAVTFFILLARIMLIIILTVVAPVAIAALLLPNTERLFKTWRKMFIGLLIVYPMIALLFGGAQLASNIIVSADANLALKLAGAAIAVLPLLFTPLLLKNSLNAIPAISNMAGKLQTRLNGWGQKGARTGSNLIGQRAAASNRGVGRMFGRAMYGNGRMGRLRQARAKHEYESPRKQDLTNRWFEEGVANDTEKLVGEVESRGFGSYEGQAALERLAAMGSTNDLVKLRQKAIDSGHLAEYDKAVASNFGSLKAKDLRSVFSGEALASKFNEVSQADLHSMSDKAIVAGAAADGNFKSAVQAAVKDPEQQRYFSQSIRDQFGGTGGTSAPTGSTPASTNGRQAAASEASIPAGYEQSASGLLIPHGASTPSTASPTDTPPTPGASPTPPAAHQNPSASATPEASDTSVDSSQAQDTPAAPASPSGSPAPVQPVTTAMHQPSTPTASRSDSEIRVSHDQTTAAPEPPEEAPRSFTINDRRGRR
jgi:hypothetical protein